MMLSLYRLLTNLAAPLIRIVLWRRQKHGKEDKSRLHERLGKPKRQRPGGPLVWLHAASVGESLSILPLVSRLLEENAWLNIMVTTGTVTSARLMAERLPGNAFHQYIPVDSPRYVRSFLRHWRPGLALWTESEFWPNLISETAGLGVPLVLINGRVSPNSHLNWQRCKGMIEKLLSRFTLCMGQTSEDAWRLISLGAGNAKCLGNLKFAAKPLPADPAMLAHLKQFLAKRPRWLAASTHPNEEDIIGRAHLKLMTRHPGLVSIIVPRHPGRGDGIAKSLRGMGLIVAQRSRLENIENDTAIYLADTMGELGLFYRLAGIAFIGKSLVPLGGQNPIEAAQLDCAILHGPHVVNFQDIFSRLKEAGGALEASDGDDLAEKAGRLLESGHDRANLSAAAKAFAAAEAGVLDAVMAELKPLLDQLGKSHASARLLA